MPAWISSVSSARPLDICVERFASKDLRREMCVEIAASIDFLREIFVERSLIALHREICVERFASIDLRRYICVGFKAAVLVCNLCSGSKNARGKVWVYRLLLAACSSQEKLVLKPDCTNRCCLDRVGLWHSQVGRNNAVSLRGLSSLVSRHCSPI